MTDDFKIPDNVGTFPATAYGECDNCHAVARDDELAAGLCGDCRRGRERVAVQLVSSLAAVPDPDPFAELDAPLLAELPDEVAARRKLRAEVRRAAVSTPQGWLQHAVEACRAECVRGSHGHEFTSDTILDELERRGGAGEPTIDHGTAIRFVLDEAASRGWCAPTGRSQPSRRDETKGRTIRIFRSCL